MTRCLPDEVRPVLAAYRRLLVDRFGERLRSLRLFGSRARGDSDPDSDADVAVVIAGVTDPEVRDAIDLAFDAWCAVGREGPVISALVWSEQGEAERLRAERRIAMDIRSEGIPA